MTEANLRPLARAFFARPTLDVARDLLGCILVHETKRGRIAGAIVEAEAYTQEDPGSHARRGLRPGNAPMFEEPGHAYVYFTYGMHWCLNAVTERDGVAGAVLLRAVEPVEGIDLMRKNRGPSVRDRDLARGPARLTQAFGVDRRQNRADLTEPPFYIGAGERLPFQSVAETPRIGLGSTQDGRRWRFVVRNSPWVSGAIVKDARARGRSR